MPRAKKQDLTTKEEESFNQATEISPEFPPIDLDKLPEPKLNGFTEGRMVHFVMVDGSHRPAVIVNAWKGSMYEHGEANMLVFTDGPNDSSDGVTYQSTWWKASVPQDTTGETPGTWHWIEPS